VYTKLRSSNRSRGHCIVNFPLVALNSKVENLWRYTSTSPYVFMAWDLVKHRDKLEFMSSGFKSNYRV
jgi:hypothetical protein